MTIRYGLLLEKDSAFDLDPFPMIPAGALKTDSIFLVENGLHLLSQVGVNNIFVVVDVGAVYLIEAISRWERYSEHQFAYSSEVADNPISLILENVFSFLDNKRVKSLALVPGNVITDLDMKQVERFHVDKKRPPMTLVVSPGIPEVGVSGMPPLYRPTQVAILEPSILPLLKGRQLQSFDELVLFLGQKGAISYYTHDGLMFEVSNEETFAMLTGRIPEE